MEIECAAILMSIMEFQYHAIVANHWLRDLYQISQEFNSSIWNKVDSSTKDIFLATDRFVTSEGMHTTCIQVLCIKTQVHALNNVTCNPTLESGSLWT